MNRKFLFVVAMLLPLFLSCGKESIDPVDAGTVAMTLSLENGRTWNEGDVILVNGVKHDISEGAGTSSAVVESVAVADSYSAAYDFGDGTVKDNVLSVNLPKSVSSDVEPMVPMVACSSSPNLAFKNLLGFMAVKIDGSEVIRKIDITSNDPDSRISGPATAALDFSGDPRLVMGAEAVPTVSIDLGKGLDLSSGQKEIVFPLPPAKYRNGFNFVIYDAEGKVMVESLEYEIEVKRGEKTTLTPITYIPGSDSPISMICSAENDAFGQPTLWASSASINVNGAPYFLESGEGTSEGTFGPVMKAEEYTVVSPARAFYGSAKNYALVSIPHVQLADAPLCETNPLVGVTASDRMDLKYAAGVVSVKISGNNIISKIQLISKKKTAYIAGKMDVEFSGDSFQTTMGAGSENSIILDCKGGASTANGKVFSFVVPAGAYQEGFRLIMTNNRNQMNVVETGAVTVERNANAALEPVLWQPSADDLGNLSAFGWANCYIVTAAGKYSFETKLVDGSNVAGISKVDWLWAHSVKGDASKLVSGISYKEGTVSFEASADEGNVLLAAFNDAGEIVWSWHIWLTDEPHTINMENRSIKDPSLGYFVMDRNLGATSAKMEDGEEIYGFFYQWGRKDPFFGGMKSEIEFDAEGNITGKTPFGNASATLCNTKYPQAKWQSELGNASNGNVDFATKNPMFFLAANETVGDNGWLAADDPARKNSDPEKGLWAPFHKTNYDPCPAGYQIPRGGTWNDLEPKQRGRWNSDFSGFIYTSTSGESTWFPAQGIRVSHPSECGALRYVDSGKSNWIGVWTSELLTARYSCRAKSLNINSVLTNSQASDDAWGYGLNVRCVKIYEN